MTKPTRQRKPFRAKFIDRTDQAPSEAVVIMYGAPIGTHGCDLVDLVLEEPGMTTLFCGRERGSGCAIDARRSARRAAAQKPDASLAACPT